MNVNQNKHKLLGRAPIGLRWRASYWFTTLVIGSGIAIDLLVYSIIIPVMPFQLERLGYTGVSALTGWLLFAYSGGLLTATIPIAVLSETYNSRRWPLIIGFVILIGSQIMLMEAPNYAVMCVARILQGVGSSVVWVVGLALLCDATPESLVGRQLGIAMIGFSIGLIFGPPIGGALYTRFGFRGPFIFGIIGAVLDLIGRFMIIERKDSLKWGYDPHTLAQESQGATTAGAGAGDVVPDPEKQKVTHARETNPKGTEQSAVSTELSGGNNYDPIQGEEIPAKAKPLSLVGVIAKLAKSRRAITASLIVLLYGVVYSSQEPSIPVHLQAIWGLSSRDVGLVFIAAVIPTLLSTPLSGYYTDKKGAEWTTLICLSFAIPWTVVLILQQRLALFVVAFGFMSFFSSGVISPLTAELAAVSRRVEGIGYAHVYGAFNLAYGVGTTIGPVVGGQMYDHLKDGWKALCFLSTGFIVLGVALSLFFIGERPLWKRLGCSPNNGGSVGS